MGFRLRRPSSEALRPLLAEASTAPLTYGPPGLTRTGEVPHGFRLRRWSTTLGIGADRFEEATAALERWAVHRGAGLTLLADGPPEPGRVVALSAPLPIGAIDATCRVVDVFEGPDEAGFAYGTLPVHPEAGEEAFTVRRSATGGVTFEVLAVSRPRQPLARACPPLAHRLQGAAAERYLAAMRAAVEG
jgi:uncharacterized protein (UPF0548 family)